MNICRETTKMVVPPGRRLRNAECGLRIEILQKARENQRTNGETCTIKFSIINCCKKSKIRNLKSKIVSEAYLNGTSQGPTPEDARKDGHIRGRSK